MRAQLVSAVQVGEDEDLGHVLHGKTTTQRLLTHHLQPIESILQHNAIKHNAIKHNAIKHNAIKHNAMRHNTEFNRMFLNLGAAVSMCLYSFY